MNNRIVVTKFNNQYIAVFIKNDKAIKIRGFDDLYDSCGQVYFGRVKTVKNNISASFVKYNNETGYLPTDAYKPETVIPVMVKKLTSGNKENELTEKITVTGLYTVLSSLVEGVKFSKKLSDSFKCNFDRGSFNNLIVRNNAQNADFNSIFNEYCYLKDIYERITFITDKRTENSVLYKGIPKLLDTIFSEDISDYEEILTDDDDAYELIYDFFTEYKANNISINIKLKHYSDSLLPLKALISLSQIMENATSRKLYLKSDAYLIFDYTEAMNVIDVNSGTTRFKGNKQEVIHNINLEAAGEIARQLKLRNLSGITIVDFINTKNKAYKDELIAYLKEELKKDDCKARCYGMTSLGLVEITRERIEKPLREQLWK